MPLGMEVGLGPDDIVLYGDSAFNGKGHSSPSPLFGQCLLWPNGCPSRQLLSCCFNTFCVISHVTFTNIESQRVLGMYMWLARLIAYGPYWPAGELFDTRIRAVHMGIKNAPVYGPW